MIALGSYSRNVVELICKIWKLYVGLVTHFVEANCTVRPELVDHEALAKRIEVSNSPVVRLVAVPHCQLKAVAI